MGEGIPEPRSAVIRDDVSRMSQLRSERLTACSRRRTRRTEARPGRQQDPSEDLTCTGVRTSRPIRRRGHSSMDPRRVVGYGVGSEEICGRSGRRESDRVRVSPEDRSGRRSRKPRQVTRRLKTHVDQRPTPQTDEGRAAQRAMRTRVATDEERLAALFGEVIAQARVFQGGGAEITTSTLASAVETAANRSLIRLFPKFGMRDNANWGKVVTKAREALPTHSKRSVTTASRPPMPYARRFSRPSVPAGTKGAELQKRFGGAAVRLAKRRDQRSDPHAARGRQHPRSAGWQGAERA